MEVLEAIRTLRSVRKFSSKPIEDHKIAAILDAATKAPSGGNSQPWEFVVVRDEKVKAKLKKPIQKTSSALFKRIGDRFLEKRRLYEEANEMVENFERIPLLIFACMDTRKASKTTESYFASIYPAVQNMMLAAKALGIGSCLTTHGATPERGEEEVKGILSLPDQIDITSLVCFGYPSLQLGPPKRIPYQSVTHWDKW